MTVAELVLKLQNVDQNKNVLVSPVNDGKKVLSVSNHLLDVEEFDDQICLWRDL